MDDEDRKPTVHLDYLWGWIDQVVQRSSIRIEESRVNERPSDIVDAIEYGYRRALDELITLIREIEDENER